MKNIIVAAVIVVAVCTYFFIQCSKSETKETTANIYLVALEGTQQSGKVIGCNDRLIPISKTLTVQRTPLEAALEELFVQKDTEQLKNFVKGPNLVLYQVTVANGVGEVYIKGDLIINSACDIPRIQEQLTETANQFTDLKKIKIYINDKSLESYLSEEKKGF